MEFFNCAMVLASVITGFAVAHLLKGVARLIQRIDQQKLY